MNFFSFGFIIICSFEKNGMDLFLSRQFEDDSNPHEIIPISFNIREILQENYHNIILDTYRVQTRVQAKAQRDAPAMSSTKPVA